MSDSKAPSLKIEINDESSSDASDDSTEEDEDCISDNEFVARMQAKLASTSNATPLNHCPSAAAPAGVASGGGSGRSRQADSITTANPNNLESTSFQAFEGTGLRTGGVLSADLLRAVVKSLGPEASPTPVQSLVWSALTSPNDLSYDDLNDSGSAVGNNGGSDGSSGSGSALSNIAMKSEAIDLLALSKTGSGKSIAFAVPVLAAVQHMMHMQQQQLLTSTSSGYALTSNSVQNVIVVPANEGQGQSAKPLALVLAPTRELCLQISGVFESLLPHTTAEINKKSRSSESSSASGTSLPPVEVFCAVGGMHYGRQHAALLERISGPAVLVATPGRLLSLCGGVSASTLARNPNAVPKTTTTTTSSLKSTVNVPAPAHVLVAPPVTAAAAVEASTPVASTLPPPPASDFMALLASAGVVSSSNDNNTAPPPMASQPLHPSSSSSSSVLPPQWHSPPQLQPTLSAGGEEEVNSGDTCAVSLSKVQLLVVDEADRLCSDEFQSDMSALSTYLVQHPVRLLFSATWGEGMDRKATRSLGPFLRPLETVRVSSSAVTSSSNLSTSSSSSSATPTAAYAPFFTSSDPTAQMTPNFFKADQTERKSDSSSSNHSSNSNHVSSATAEALVVAPSVRQTVEVLVTSSSSGKGVGRTRRVEALLHSLKAGQKALVFVLHKTEAKALAKHLNVALGDADSSSSSDGDDDEDDDNDEAVEMSGTGSSISQSRSSDTTTNSSYAGCLHGDMSTLARSNALTSFRNGDFPVLVCTDVAARGLDVPGVALVVNMSVGITVADYVHRCGRTGRAGQKGRSHTFVVAGDERHAPTLIQVLGATRQDVPPLLVEVAHRWEVKAAKDAKKKTAGGSELDEDEEELQLQRALNREKQRAQQQAKVNKGNANGHKNKKAIKGKGSGGGKGKGGGGGKNGRR